MIATLARLPYDGDEIVRRLVAASPAAVDESDEDFTTFWLVTADLLQKKGIESEARARALQIIERQTNLRVLEALGASPSDRRARARSLDRLAETLAEIPSPRNRRVLAKPERLLTGPGEIFLYPVDSDDHCRNPYSPDPAVLRFTPTGWRSCLIVAASHAMDYLAWYQVAPSLRQWPEKPSPSEAAQFIDPDSNGVGRISSSYMKRIGLEPYGSIEPPVVDSPRDERVTSVVVSDISIAGVSSVYLLDDR